MGAHYKYKPVAYYLLTFACTYFLWFLCAYFSFQPEKIGLSVVLMLMGLFVPFIISSFIVFTSNNVALKNEFIDRLTNLNLIQIRMLPLFLFLMPASVLISIFLSIMFGGSAAQLQLAGGFSFSPGIVSVLFLLILAATFEELGWRGYAFDSLQSRYTFFKASLIFSVLWSFWHFPLIFINKSYQYEVVAQGWWFGLNFFVSIIPMGIIISWICVKNNKSILAAIVFHFITNMSQEMFAVTQATKCIQTLVLAIIAAVIVVIDKELFFSSKHLAPIKQ